MRKRSPFDGYALKPTAYHEAGHIVVALHLGIPFFSARLERGRQKNGRGRAGWARIGESKNRSRQATMLLAGYVAQGIHIGHRRTSVTKRNGIYFIRDNSDDLQAAECFGDCWYDGIKHAKALAARIIRKNWRQVDEVARFLFKHRAITRLQIERRLGIVIEPI